MYANDTTITLAKITMFSHIAGDCKYCAGVGKKGNVLCINSKTNPTILVILRTLLELESEPRLTIDRAARPSVMNAKKIPAEGTTVL
jgi:hypothetical protein